MSRSIWATFVGRPAICHNSRREPICEKCSRMGYAARLRGEPKICRGGMFSCEIACGAIVMSWGGQSNIGTVLRFALMSQGNGGCLRPNLSPIMQGIFEQPTLRGQQ